MTEPPPASRSQRFIGVVLMACGAILAALTGLCSGLLLLPNDWRQPGALLIVAIVGGIPFVAGLATLVVGVMIYRQGRG